MVEKLNLGSTPCFVNAPFRLYSRLQSVFRAGRVRVSARGFARESPAAVYAAKMGISKIFRVTTFMACASIMVGCRPPSTAAQVKEHFAQDGDFKRFDADPELASLTARFAADRPKLVAESERLFTPNPGACQLSPGFIDRVLGLSKGRADVMANGGITAREEKLVASAEGGTCEGGEARGPVTFVVSYVLVVEGGALGAVSSRTQQAYRFEGKIGENGFEGPVVRYSRSSKPKMSGKVGQGESVSLETPDNGVGEWTYGVWYAEMEGWALAPTYKKRGMGWGFDSRLTMRITSLHEPQPDGRVKETVWSGERLTQTSLKKADGTLHGKTRVESKKVGTIDIPAMDMCYVDGKIVKTHDCP